MSLKQVETERTPLLRVSPISREEEVPEVLSGVTPSCGAVENSKRPPLISPFRKLLLTALLLSISFSYTATTLLFAFRTITCQIYYETHDEPTYLLEKVNGHNHGFVGQNISSRAAPSTMLYLLLSSIKNGSFNALNDSSDRCALAEIESNTATAISLMVTLTTVSGVLNLLTTGFFIRKFGVKFTMVLQTASPCFRNVCQTFAIYTGGILGIRILQWTQLITILGGGAGYLLTANTYVAALVLPEERTGAFGILQGTTMFGTAIAFTLGGITGDRLGAPAPFEITLVLLILSTILSGVFLPYIPPVGSSETSPPAKKNVIAGGSGTETTSQITSDSIAVDSSALENGNDVNNVSPKPAANEDGIWNAVMSFALPLKVFLPTQIDSEDAGELDDHSDKGKSKKYYGLLILGIGGFMSVLATGFIPLMLQMSATNRFGFGPSENGYLMSATSLSRAMFLTLAFPRIIKRGRSWYSRTSPKPAQIPSSEASSPRKNNGSSSPEVEGNGETATYPTDATSFEPLLPEQQNGAQEPLPLQPPKPTDEAHGSHFDLMFLRCSILLDAVLTACTSLASTGWHMYLAAVILPLASGSAAASKGCVMDMVPTSKQPDALSAIALIETLALVTTVSLFGAIYAALSTVGKSQYVFLLNAATALMAGLLLMFVKFPPKKMLLTPTV